MLVYNRGNAYWRDTKETFDGTGANNTINLIIQAYQKIENSEDDVLKNQLHKLEDSEKSHWVEESQYESNGVGISANETGDSKKGDRVSTHTRIRISEWYKENWEKKNGIPFSFLGMIAHELRHQYDYEIGNMVDNQEGQDAKDPAEIRAVNNENRARKMDGQKRKRTKYNGVEIDPEELENPPNNR